jgi:SMI1 / KNR4 family (SUKH-1)
MGFSVDEVVLVETERRLGRKLPSELRDRLLANNGGEIMAEGDAWTLHPVWDNTDRRRMARTTSHIIHETEQARQWRGFPEDGISVATNGTGDHLVLRGGSDEIELWDHETSACRPIVVSWSPRDE